MAVCVSPVTLKNKETNSRQTVPCGKCYQCLKNRVNGWAFRLDQEMKRAQTAHFVTLTYDEHHVISTDSGLHTLYKPDLQRFFKLLRHFEERKNNNPHKIKYYACGEYGTNGERPHYHIILYNASEAGIKCSWIDSKGYAMGIVHVGKAETASMRYVAKYTQKPYQIPQFDGDDRQKEFSLMSKKLGDNYLSEPIRHYHLADASERYCIDLGNGDKIAMPRYYKEKLFEGAPLLKKEVIEEVQEKIKLQQLEFLKKYGPEDLELVEARIDIKTKSFFKNTRLKTTL